MPIYQYLCQNCGHIFEEFFGSSWKSSMKEHKCPKCKKMAKRIFTWNSISTPSIATSGELAEDSEEYREMHYYEKKKDWYRAAKAAEGVSEFAKNKFLEKARQEKAT